jgi:molybdopterin-guanine dinucleotide biosynthesis protein A
MARMSLSHRLGAVVLAGGTAARLDGADKAAIEVDGRTLLEHALDALVDADEVVAVMPAPVPTSRPVTVTIEDPAQGGPAAGLLTGAAAFARPPERLVVLAVDMPWVTATTVRRLLRAAVDHDGAFLTDPTGRRHLAGVVGTAALQRADPGPEQRHGLPMHRLLADLDLVAVAPRDREGHDIDTWDDVRGARE